MIGTDGTNSTRMTSTRKRARLIAGGVIAAVLAAAAVEADGDGPVRIWRDEITPELRLSVERGFAYLVREQSASGAFAAKFPVAINSLVGLAFLAGGHSHRVGPYTAAFQRGLDHLLGFQKRSPAGYFDDGESRMYGHGFATLFLAEAYGMLGEQDARVRVALEAAVRLIEASQATDGGWDYEPSRTGASDTSITVCQTMALRAARNLGIAVRPDVVQRARAFIQEAQNDDGGFAYRTGSYLPGARDSEFPRSAAGVCILLSLGDYHSPQVRRGFEYLSENYDRFTPFPYYGAYYCAQAMFQAGGSYWRDYFGYIRRRLVERQRADGSWSGSVGGAGQATAMALIILQVPYRYLPISER